MPYVYLTSRTSRRFYTHLVLALTTDVLEGVKGHEVAMGVTGEKPHRKYMCAINIMGINFIV